jgi:hypothetical protein
MLACTDVFLAIVALYSQMAINAGVELKAAGN